MTPEENSIIDQAMAILAANMRKPGQLLSNPERVKQYLQLQIGAEKVEKFAALFLDSQHQLIDFEVMFTGTLNQTSVYPREVVVRALHHHAACVVLAHNHPSGKTDPSPADIALTRQLKSALELVDIRILDHIIVAPNGATSLAEGGLMPY